MTSKIKALYTRYQTEIIYIIVGGLTTLVNFIVFFIAIEIFNIHYIVANIVAWIAAVLFAYTTNRTWVFKSKNKNILLEICLFAISRIFSLLLETGLLFIIVTFLGANELIAKAILAVLVVICNYITGRWIVFKRRR